MVHMTTTLADIDVLPFQAPIGAEVRCGDLRALDDETFKAVHRAFLDKDRKSTRLNSSHG